MMTNENDRASDLLIGLAELNRMIAQLRAARALGGIGGPAIDAKIDELETRARRLSGN
ncbi:MAG: hypothetical protein AB7L09_22040 [Nitrospira sp.]